MQPQRVLTECRGGAHCNRVLDKEEGVGDVDAKEEVHAAPACPNRMQGVVPTVQGWWWCQ